MIVRQVPDEEAHYCAYDQAGNELEGAYRVEWYARIGRRRHFGLAVERVEDRHIVYTVSLRLFSSRLVRRRRQ